MKSFPLLKRRQKILVQLQELKPMRRGTITEQYLEAKRKDGFVVRRGPYYLYTYKDQQRTVSRRLCDPEQIRTYRQQIEAFRLFQQLTAELLSLGEQLCEVPGEDSPAVKKRLLCAGARERGSGVSGAGGGGEKH